MYELKIIGTVKSEKTRTGPHFPFYSSAQIEIKPEYVPALKNLEYNSHIWVLCLYDPKDKEQLQVKPRRVDHSLGLFGTLALRTPNHPNPIGLTLVKLIKVEGNVVHVDKLDAFNGTPVIDIKPYYAHDIILSPVMPNIIHTDPVQREIALLELAINYHQDQCFGMALAIKMIMAMEARGVVIDDDKTVLDVQGGACLADNLQGLCRARLSNPPRFTFALSKKVCVVWQTPDCTFTVTTKEGIPKTFDEVMQLTYEDLFDIQED